MNSDKTAVSSMTSSETTTHIWGVAELTRAIKGELEPRFVRLTVQGEVSNSTTHSSGHIYFTLKDAEAQITAVFFRADVSNSPHRPKNGDKVIVEASLGVYLAGGRYQLIVRSVKLQGVGELLLKLEELKKKIHAKGYFKADHKKKLPLLPKTIGVVTSPTGAVIQDILNVLSRRAGGFHLILNPVKVQGEGAAQEVARAIDFFNERLPVDVMIVGRGGGSLEDLWCFNEEVVAEAIFRSKIPIICAVGHECDHTIAEYVADVRAPTPSAAAEMVIAERSQQLRQLCLIEQRLRYTLRQMVSQRKLRLADLFKQPLIDNPYQLLTPWQQRLDELRQDADRIISLRLEKMQFKLTATRRWLLSCRPTARLQAQMKALKGLRSAIIEATKRKLRSQSDKLKRQEERLLESAPLLIRTRRKALEAMAKTLAALNPYGPLERGYSMIVDAEGHLVSDSEQVRVGSMLKALLRSGGLTVKVEDKELVKKGRR